MYTVKVGVEENRTVGEGIRCTRCRHARRRHPQGLQSGTAGRSVECGCDVAIGDGYHQVVQGCNTPTARMMTERSVPIGDSLPRPPANVP